MAPLFIERHKMKVMDESRYQAMLAIARATDHERSALERQAGFASPKDSGLCLLLRTAQDALECAVKTNDWQIVCEGIVFLEQAIAAFAPHRKGVTQ